MVSVTKRLSNLVISGALVVIFTACGGEIVDEGEVSDEGDVTSIRVEEGRQIVEPAPDQAEVEDELEPYFAPQIVMGRGMACLLMCGFCLQNYNTYCGGVLGGLPCMNPYTGRPCSPL